MNTAPSRTRLYSMVDHTVAACRSARSLLAPQPGESAVTLQPCDSASIALWRQQVAPERDSWNEEPTTPATPVIDQDAAWSTWLDITSKPDKPRGDELQAVQSWFDRSSLPATTVLTKQAARGSPKAQHQPETSPASAAFHKRRASVSPSPSTPSVCSPKSIRGTKHCAAVVNSPAIPVNSPTVHNPEHLVQTVGTTCRREMVDESDIGNERHTNVSDKSAADGPPTVGLDNRDLAERWSALRHDLKHLWSRLPAEVRQSPTPYRAMESYPVVLPVGRNYSCSTSQLLAQQRTSSCRTDDAVSKSPPSLIGIHEEPGAEILAAIQEHPTSARLRRTKSVRKLAQRASRSLRSVKSSASLAQW